MALTKISTGMLKQDAASSDLNIDAGTLYIDVSNNRVGVNNTSPSFNLDVSGTGQFTGSLEVDSSILTRQKLQISNGRLFEVKGTSSAFTVRDGSAAADRLTILAGGSVGIGTTSPETNLHIEDTSAYSLVRLVASATSVAGIDFGDADDRDIGRVRYNNSDDSMVFHTNAAEQMRITSAGNVGIGTASPASLLNVYTDAGRDFKVDHGTANRTILSTDRGMIVKAGAGYSLDLDTGSTSGTIRFLDNGTAHSAFDANGNLGIGTTTPDEKLHVQGTILATPILYSGSVDDAYLIAGTTSYDGTTTNWGTYGFQHRFKANSGGTPRISIDTRLGEVFTLTEPGNLGLGISAPIANLHISDTTTAEFYADGTQTADGTLFDLVVRNGTDSVSSIKTLRDGANDAGALTFSTQATSTGIITEHMRIDSRGNIGMGINSPNHTLEVVKSDTNNTDLAVYNTYPYGSGGLHSARLLLGKIENSTTRQAMSIIEAAPVSNTSSTAGYLRFLTRNSSTVSEKMRLDQFGRLNIGNATNFANAAGDKLQIGNTSGSNGLTIVSSNTTGGSIFFADNNNNDAGKILYDHGSNDLILYTNRTEKLRLDSDGYLFLGHSGHSWGTFHDVAQIGRTGAIANYDDGANQQTIITNNSYYGASGYTAITGDAAASYLNLTAGDVVFYAATTVTAGSAQTFNPTVTIKNSGDVGIGTTSPNAKLEIDASAESQSAPREAIRIAGPNQPYNSNGAQDIKWKFDFAGSSIIRSWRGSSWDTYLSFYTTPYSAGADSPVERLHIDDDGSIGIGTNNPSTILTIKKAISSSAYGSAASVIDFKTYFPGYDEDTVKARISAGVSDQTVLQTTRGYLAFSTSEFADPAAETLTEKMRIESNGNVGIGTTDPTTKLSVEKAATDPTNNLHRVDLGIVSEDNGYASGYAASGMRILGQAKNSSGDDHTVFLEFNTRDPSLNGSHGTSGFVTLTTPDSQGTYGTGQLDFYIRNAAAYSFPNDPAVSSSYWMSSLFTIKSNGNIGIGKTSPSYRLHMDRDDGSDNVLAIQNNTAARLSELRFIDESDVTQVRFYYDNGSNRAYQHVNGNGLTIYSSQTSSEIAKFGLPTSYNSSNFNGRVGIGGGVTTPADLLDITDGVSDTKYLRTHFPAAGTYNAAASNTEEKVPVGLRFGWYSEYWQIGGARGGGADIDGFVISETGQERLVISNTGNVGIGATAPQQTLSVVTGSNSAIPTLGSHGGNFSILKQDGTSSGAYGILMGLDTSGKSWMQVQRTDGTATAYDMLLQPSGGAVRIASSTYLGNSSETLSVVGTADTACFRTTASSGGTALHLNRSASVGNLLYLTYGAYGPVGSIYTDGAGTTYNTTSDRRLKDNIVDAPSASEDIDAIQVRSFDWKTNGAHQKYGMVAQELLEVVPEAVSQGYSEEDMMGVDYSKLVPMLVKEIQDLRARVLELENK